MLRSAGTPVAYASIIHHLGDPDLALDSVELDGSIENDELREMIDHSYELVVSKLPGPSGADSPGTDRDPRSRSMT
jgi:hypothetical protein